MEYALDFSSSDDPYREIYEQYVPEIIGKVATEDGAIPSLRCIMPNNHGHGDTSPSAWVNLQTGVFGCSVCGAYSVYRFLLEVMSLDSVTVATMLSEYRSDSTRFPKQDNFAKISAPPDAGMTRFAEWARNNLSAELAIVREYCSSRGITYETLSSLNVGYVPQSPGQLECLCFPYYVNGKVTALRGRTADGRKGGVKGSRFIPYNLDNIEHNTVLLCEGESDTLRAHQAVSNMGVPISVVGVPGAKFRREWEREFSGVTKVFILPQADQPSYDFANKAREALGPRCEIIKLPWRRGELGKDICDWLLHHADGELTEMLPVAPPSRKLLNHEELLEMADQEVPWIIKDLIAEGDKILIGGEQKAMKTFTTLFAVKYLTTGEDLFGRPEWAIDRPRKVLFVEEEGSQVQLAKRAQRIVGDVDPEMAWWMHKKSIKLDVPESYEELCAVIKQVEPDVVVLDPLQRMHSVDENDAGSMGIVWHSIHNLSVRFPKMATIVIHHFKKGGSGENGWNSFRGSSRSAGEADVGIFISRDAKTTEDGKAILHVKIDGRDLPRLADTEKPGEMVLLVDTDNWDAQIRDFQIDVKSSGPKLSPDEEMIALLKKKQGGIKDITERSGWSPGKVNRILKSLSEAGKIEKIKVTIKDNAWEYQYRAK